MGISDAEMSCVTIRSFLDASRHMFELMGKTAILAARGGVRKQAGGQEREPLPPLSFASVLRVSRLAIKASPAAPMPESELPPQSSESNTLSAPLAVRENEHQRERTVLACSRLRIARNSAAFTGRPAGRKLAPQPINRMRLHGAIVFKPPIGA